jgi:hypothetical protein
MNKPGSKPGSPAAAAAEIQRQNQNVAEIVKQNNARKVKEQRRQLQRERVIIRVESEVLNNPQSSTADKDKAIATIGKTVLNGTGLSVSDIANPEALARVSSRILKDPAVVELGVRKVLDLKVSDEDARSIPAPVVQRLTKLAKETSTDPKQKNRAQLAWTEGCQSSCELQTGNPKPYQRAKESDGTPCKLTHHAKA